MKAPALFAKDSEGWITQGLVLILVWVFFGFMGCAFIGGILTTLIWGNGTPGAVLGMAFAFIGIVPWYWLYLKLDPFM